MIGPGLGRDEITLKFVEQCIFHIRQRNIPLVIDGDGLWLVAHEPSLVANYPLATLTPNAMEFRRLWSKVVDNIDPSSPSPAPPIPTTVDAPVHEWPTAVLASKLGNVTIVRKGKCDIVSNGTEGTWCDTESTPRRCGGLGDILAGTMGTFHAWYGRDDPIAAAWAACHITRNAAYCTYSKLDCGRGMIASDVITSIPRSLRDLQSEQNRL